MMMIDLRSDTVTKPTAGMRAAMAAAEVGDDVYGEDPTVNRLEERVAVMFGKEAALYVPSGSMSNQLAIKCHLNPGDELICEEFCHLYNWEAGSPAILSGVTCRTVRAEHGILQNPLVSEGYLSIGCAPCTAKPLPGADPRSGRWAGLAKTECGLHAGDLLDRVDP